MDTPISKKLNGVSILIYIYTAFLFTGCKTNTDAQSPYIPPNPIYSQTELNPYNPTPSRNPIIPSPQPSPSSIILECSDNLLYIDDLTFPDWTTIKPGMEIEKQWKVENNGTCNWDYRYRLLLITGERMGAEIQQALFPARAGSQVTIQIRFTAPLEPGTYHNVWQAIDPIGQPFGDPISILVVVVP